MRESMDYEHGKNLVIKSNKSNKLNKSNRNLPVAVNLNITTDNCYHKTLNTSHSNNHNNTNNDRTNSVLESIPFNF